MAKSDLKKFLAVTIYVLFGAIILTYALGIYYPEKNAKMKISSSK